MTATHFVDVAAQSLANRRQSRRSGSSRGGWARAALAVAGVLAARRKIERKER